MMLSCSPARARRGAGRHRPIGTIPVCTGARVPTRRPSTTRSANDFLLWSRYLLHGCARRQACAPGAGRVTPGTSSSSSSPVDALQQELNMPTNKLDDKVRERVIVAIRRRNYRVTAGDVTAAAGVTLREAEEALQALAHDSLAALEVSDQGDLVYAFPDDFQTRITSRSLLQRLKPALAAAAAGLGYVSRVAFGSCLVASVVVVWVAVAVALSSSSRDDRDRRGGGGYQQSASYYAAQSNRMGFRMAMDLTDLLTFWDPYYWRTGRQRRERGESMSFIESIFSFVFGDGDPNESFEERRWRALAAAISARDGVVAAEEIAPYLDPPAGAAAAAAGGRGGYVDESYVLPALIKLGGESFVSDDGHLLYRFPSLQATTSRKQQRKAASAAASSSAVVGAVPQEATWSLTAASGGQQIGTVLLGVANVVGVLVLSSFAADPQYRVVLMREGMGWVLGALPALQAYAAAFFLIPAVRAVLNARANAAIQRRNDARQQAAQLLRTAASVPMMVAKLRAAREAAAASGGVRELKSQDAVFSSERETGKQVNSFDLEEWDRKMQERGGGGR